MECGALFTTLEQTDLSKALVIQTADGQLTPFDRDKLFLSIYRSCEHRDQAVSDAAGLTHIIIGNILQDLKGGTLRTSAVADAALQALKRFDATAATIYTAFYKRT